MRKILFVFLSLLFILQASAITQRCSICRKRIAGRYFKSQGKTFCSERCFNKTKPLCSACGKRCLKGSYKQKKKFYCSKKCLETTLPKCTVCGKPCTQGSYTKNKKYYCSKKCVETTLPKCAMCEKPFRKGVVVKTPEGDRTYCSHCGSLPRCFACGLPAPSGTYLKDGRFLGRDCGDSAIFSESEGRELFNDIREKIRKDLGWSTNHRIHFRLVDQKTLQKSSENYEPGMEMGLYKYNFTLKTRTETSYSLLKGRKEKTTQYRTNKRYSVFLLSGLPEWKFIEVCGHELGHDWMQANFPKIKDLKIKEGWAEYFASRVNDIYGQSHLNNRMRKNTSRIYGEGYRFIRDYVKKHGMNGLLEYFKKLNK